MKTYHTLYDVQQLLKNYGSVVYVGKRLWDIEMMAIEIDSLYRAQVLDLKTYQIVKGVLLREHEEELKKEQTK
ncbi:YqgQ family protein [Vagococcus intermedius]|uniref:YqgQ family protein n=1 Tax=Vagococcus intermedius TaxID=2991418 RepID=A0AAF0I7F6_9ENTE|nr:YqgQ family protein [Vagococcus intermedius]WEG72976.1 YqgQ family protein [Vagococcus intermedius]WEG75062.1 YqgQ family protein [Vagococcus intermedius]